MKAARFSQFGGPEVLEIVDLPDPHPGPGQVRIVVHAAGISATDPKLRAGTLRFGAQLPQTTGRDVAGVVDEIGEGVTDVAVGDRVFGVSDDGAGAAELALLTFRAIIPPSLGFVDAAGLPVALETATRAIDQLGVKSGSTLFINGASGGIGSTAVQLAAARVIGAASAANQNYIGLLGAEPVTYGEGMAERVRALAPGGVDAALDVAGSGVLPQLIDLASGSQNVVTLADFDGSKEHGVRFSNGFADGHAFHSLAEVGELIEAGRFWLPVDRHLPAHRDRRSASRQRARSRTRQAGASDRLTAAVTVTREVQGASGTSRGHARDGSVRAPECHTSGHRARRACSPSDRSQPPARARGWLLRRGAGQPPGEIGGGGVSRTSPAASLHPDPARRPRAP
jgi:NADPH:quinone reductase-like Zn-dependent oxidoreductase